MATPNFVDQKLRRMKVSELTMHPSNPRQGDVGAIHTSIDRNGFYGALIVQKNTGLVLAGNHRLLAAMQAGATSVPVLEVDVDDATATRILLADNRTNDLATYDNELLADMLQALAAADDLLGTGYDGDDLDQLLADLNREPDEEPAVDRGAGLEVLDVSIDEPNHECHHGDVWRLGEEHVLVVADVNYEWDLYAPLLSAGAAFAPYPTPMLAMTYVKGPLVMVQPSTYLAGHVLDKYAAKHGPDTVRKQAA